MLNVQKSIRILVKETPVQRSSLRLIKVFRDTLCSINANQWRADPQEPVVSELGSVFR